MNSKNWIKEAILLLVFALSTPAFAEEHKTTETEKKAEAAVSKIEAEAGDVEKAAEKLAEAEKDDTETPVEAKKEPEKKVEVIKKKDPAIQYKESSTACALVGNFWGDVQVLNSTRTKLLDVKKNNTVNCGSYVSVNEGWIELKHREGGELRVGSDSLIRVNEEGSGDQFVVLRGYVLAKHFVGGGTLKVLTSQARANVKRAEALILVSDHEEESQMVVLKNRATLENRFEGGNPITVMAGEASSLQHRVDRLAPSTPKAVSIASLRGKLDTFGLPQKDLDPIYAAVKARNDRKFAQFTPSKKQKEEGIGWDAPKVNRGIASTKESYVRHPDWDGEDTQTFEEQVARRLTGGDPTAEKLTRPDVPAPERKLAGKISVVDQAAEEESAREREAKKKFDSGKKKLIEDLRKLGAEE